MGVGGEGAVIPLFKPYAPFSMYYCDAWDRVLQSGYLAEGEEVASFEQEFGDFINYPHCLATSSCTAALHLALVLSGAGPGTEVISTPMTAEPTNLAILHAGATLVWADVNPRNGNIDWESVRRKITDRTVAVICVHYGGIPALNYDMWDVPGGPEGIDIIEDCAHALGATWENAHVGKWGDWGAFSFQAIKHLTTGDGGMLVCKGGELDRARRLRWFGIDRKTQRTDVDIKELGYKYNMNNLTAAMGRVQLAHIDQVIERCKSNGAYYESQLSTILGVDAAYVDPHSDPSYWLFTVLLETEADRDSLSERLTEAGVGNGLAHCRNDKHTIFADSKCFLPGLDKFYSTMLHIPCGWWVTDEDRERIVEVIASA